MWGSERRTKVNLWVKHRNRSMLASKPGHALCLGNSRADAYLLALWCPVQNRRESDPGFRTELENLVGSVKGKGPSGRTARPKVPMDPSGADCSVVLRRRRNFRGREQAIRLRIIRVNGQPEELEGPEGRRQPSRGGTSRVSREAQARICESLGVKLPGATRPRGAIPPGRLGQRWGKVESALLRRRRSHSPTVPRCLRMARYGRAVRDLRRTGRVSGWHRSKQTYK